MSVYRERSNEDSYILYIIAGKCSWSHIRVDGFVSCRRLHRINLVDYRAFLVSYDFNPISYDVFRRRLKDYLSSSQIVDYIVL